MVFSSKHCLQYGVLTCRKGLRWVFAPSKLPSDPAPGQVGIRALEVISDPAAAQVGIRALKVIKVSLFAVIPPLPRWGFAPSKLSKHRYSQ